MPRIPAPASSSVSALRSEPRDACGEIRHVERSRYAVDQAHTDQEQQRGHKIDDDIVQPGLNTRQARAVQRKAVGGGQQELEEHEQIEEVAGQERAAEAHQQELEQWMEMRSRTMPPGK